MMKNVIKCCLVCSVLISNIFVYPCCKKKPQPPKQEDGQKYIEYVLGITSADIIFSFSFDVQLNDDGKPEKCEFHPPYKSQAEIINEYFRHFKNNADLEGCSSYWLLKPIKKNNYLTFSCSVYFVQKGKGNPDSSQSLEKYFGDIVDFFADISFYKLVEFKYDKLKGCDWSFYSNVLPKTKKFTDLIAMYNMAVKDQKFKNDLSYTTAKNELEVMKDRIYKCK